MDLFVSSGGFHRCHDRLSVVGETGRGCSQAFLAKKKFQDRRKAIGRVWNAIQSGVWKGQPQAIAAKPKARPKVAKPAKPIEPTNNVGRGKQASAKPAHEAAQRPNKKADVIMMMQRTNGATLAEIMAATHWQKHTIRGFVSILGSKGGLIIQSSKNTAGERTYTIAK